MRSRISDGKSRRRNGFDGTRCLGAGFSRTRSSSSKNSARCDFLSRIVEGGRFQVPRLVARGNEVYRKQNVHGTELRIGHGFHSSHGLVVSALIEDWHGLESSLVISRSLETKPFALGWDLDKLNKLEAKGNVRINKTKKECNPRTELQHQRMPSLRLLEVGIRRRTFLGLPS